MTQQVGSSPARGGPPTSSLPDHSQYNGCLSRLTRSPSPQSPLFSVSSFLAICYCTYQAQTPWSLLKPSL